MSEDISTAGPQTPGQLIRAARESAGLHIVALAAALKVPVRKLEALESDRWEELTDATFARALASSVARHLRMDPTAVLAGLPSTKSDALDIPVGLGRAPQASSGLAMQPMRSPVIWAVAAILLLAVVVYTLPPGLLVWQGDEARTEPAAITPTVPNVASPTTTSEPLVAPAVAPNTPPAPVSGGSDAATAVAVLPSTPAAPKPDAQPQPAPTPAVVGPGTSTRLHMVLKAPSWIEVTDANGKLRLQKVVSAGEVLDFDDASGYAVVVGNASGVEVAINGQSKDLAEFTRNNVARFQAR